MHSFKVVTCLAKLACMVFFQFLACFALEQANPLLFFTSLAPVVFIPIIFTVFIRAREATSVKMRTMQADCMFEVAEGAHNAIANFRLIADYAQRPAEVERFLRRVRAYNDATVNSSVCNVNNEYFSQWVAMAAQCAWIFFGGDMLLDGSLSLSLFLTNLAVYKTVGGEFQKIYLAYVRSEVNNFEY